MMSEQTLENRHAAPGVNSRSHASANTAADLEVLKEIENIYFTEPISFDASRYVLESLSNPANTDEMQKLFDKLKRQQQVVSDKVLHLITQKRDCCDQEFIEVQNIGSLVESTIETCRDVRSQLKTASDNLTVSAFVILANYKKRQVIRSILQALDLLQRLRSVEKDVSELMAKKDYSLAIDLILKSRKEAAAHKEYVCIKDLSVRLQDVLQLTEEKLDNVLASICYNFDSKQFRCLRKAYGHLGKIQTAMEQLHMHYSLAVSESAIESIKPYITDVHFDSKFHELCTGVPLNKAPVCLLNLCENLFLIMKSYKRLVDWHVKHDEEDHLPSINATVEIENNVSREYVRQKLQSGLLRLWNEVQGKVSVFLKSTGLEEYPFEKFVQILGILRKLTQVAEVFCGDKSDVLQDFIKTNSVSYIKNYHHGRMDELKLFLENEGWEVCPVKPNFNLLNLQEFKPFKRYLNLKGDISLTKAQSDGASSVNSHDDSVYIVKYFSSKTNHTPFEIFRSENVTNDDIFGVEPELEESEESEEESEELKRDYVDEDVTKDSPSKHTTVILTNTTLSVLRICGQYLQICRYLPQISLDVVMLMNQLFDYYFYTVHLFFTSDLVVASSTLYSNKLNLTLKRICNHIEGDDKGFSLPELPQHFDMNNEESLHCLSERVVAVESVIFLAQQYEILQPYLESIVASHQRLILEHFTDSTLNICTDLRMPVYMCSASRAVDARSTLISMSQVKWDVKSIAVEHSPYVDTVIRQVQVFALRLDNLSSKVPLNSVLLSSIWTMVCKFIVHLLVEGFSNASKCSNAGRGLMQLDYRQLLVKLEKICGLKPVPYQEYVDRYVKAYYLPRADLEDFIRDRIEYSNKHLLALIYCSCENKRDRQELAAILETKES